MSNPSEEEILASVLSKLAKFKRKAWKPIIKIGKDIIPSSKFGGTPLLYIGEDWPTCKACQSNMRFFLQIDSEDLPQADPQLFWEGTLQLFYCSNKKCNLTKYPPYFPFNPRQLTRIIAREQTTSIVTVPQMVDKFRNEWQTEDKYEDYFFEQKFIIDWEEIEDYPNYIEKQHIGYYLNDYNDDFEPDEDEEYILADKLSYIKDKLSGWPYWANSRSTPDCPVDGCKRMMNKLLFQLSSFDNLHYNWGDSDNGFILQCPEHPEQITFIAGY